MCAVQELASVDTGRAWHSACQLCVCGYIVYVCGWRTGLWFCTPPSPPLTAVRNLPFSLLKAGETMEGVRLSMGGGGWRGSE